jgi:putative redox protein
MKEIVTVRAVSDGAPYLVELTNGRHTWSADEPHEAGGADAGPTPNQLLLSSLGACTCVTVRMYAARKGWTLRRVEVELQFNPDGPAAAGGSDIRRRITLHGELSVEQRERLLDIANRCPIHKVLTDEVRIATSLA